LKCQKCACLYKNSLISLLASEFQRKSNFDDSPWNLMLWAVVHQRIYKACHIVSVISMNRFVSMSASLLAVGLGSVSLAAQASVPQTPQMRSVLERTVTVAQADQSALITENRELLVNNRALARKIATKLGITSTGEIPTTGTPLEQNQVMILQNQETFKAIAEKVGATAPTLTPVEAADTAEKNHKLLLQNKSIVVEILKKLDLPLAPPVELTGTFVEKNHTLLKGNAGALAKIATKLDVK
jgi:hypothetical protein